MSGTTTFGDRIIDCIVISAAKLSDLIVLTDGLWQLPCYGNWTWSYIMGIVHGLMGIVHGLVFGCPIQPRLNGHSPKHGYVSIGITYEEKKWGGKMAEQLIFFYKHTEQFSAIAHTRVNYFLIFCILHWLLWEFI